MSKCPVCKTRERKFFLGQKLVCNRCDQLTFDIEIECDEIPARTIKLKSKIENEKVAVAEPAAVN